MAARIYTDSDADLRWLKGKVCAVVGFGSQGRAQALNVRNGKIKVVIGLYPGSKSRARAKRDGLRVFDTGEAVRRGDIIFLALSDTTLPEVFSRDIAPNLRAGQTLLLAHGFAILYRTIIPSPNVDVIMAAPKGLGPMVRREYLGGRGVPALFAVHRGARRRAKGIAEMTSLISDTAKWGKLTVGPRIVDQQVQRYMKAALRDIRSGRFAREFLRKIRTGRHRYRKLSQLLGKRPIETVGWRLRNRMLWKGKKTGR